MYSTAESVWINLELPTFFFIMKAQYNLARLNNSNEFKITEIWNSQFL